MENVLNLTLANVNLVGLETCAINVSKDLNVFMENVSTFPIHVNVLKVGQDLFVIFQSVLKAVNMDSVLK